LGPQFIVLQYWSKQKLDAWNSTHARTTADSKRVIPVSALANALTEYPVGTEMARLFKANNVEEYYSGRVTGYDIKKKWYRVIYDDGDAEELSRSD
jgi:Lamin-B receptor of TUDOR domain